MLFTGQHEHTIDAKKRLAIPAEFRSQWRTEEDGAAWFAVPWLTTSGAGVIRLYTERDFHAKAVDRELTLTPDEDEAELQATLFGLAARIPPDSAGRVRIPDEMLEIVGMPNEVVLVGAGDRLEVRDRVAWRESREERLKQLPELLARLGRKRSGGGE